MRFRVRNDYFGWSFFSIGFELHRTPRQFSRGRDPQWHLRLCLGTRRVIVETVPRPLHIPRTSDAVVR